VIGVVNVTGKSPPNWQTGQNIALSCPAGGWCAQFSKTDLSEIDVANTRANELAADAKNLKNIEKQRLVEKLEHQHVPEIRSGDDSVGTVWTCRSRDR
jgi:hypothetical protein